MGKKELLGLIGLIISQKAKLILNNETHGNNEFASSIAFKVDEDSVSVGTNVPHAPFVEWGTGLRGSTNFKQYFNEKKPQYTIPIVPKNKKALHWKSSSGKNVFAKSTKGMKPTAPLRRGLFETKNDVINTIIKTIEANPGDFIWVQLTNMKLKKN